MNGDINVWVNYSLVIELHITNISQSYLAQRDVMGKNVDDRMKISVLLHSFTKVLHFSEKLCIHSQ